MDTLSYYIALPVLGLVVGYLSGLFGVGGGFMLTPLLNVLLGIPMPIAVGSSLAQMILVAALSARRHHAAGFADKRLALYMGPGVIIGSFGGMLLLVFLANLGKMRFLGSDVPVVSVVLNGVFVLLLTVIAVRFWRDANAAENTSNAPLLWANGPIPVALPVCGIERCSLVSIILFSMVIGVMAGLLGVGGGVIIVPVLVSGFGIALRVTIGTSSLIILLSSIVATAMQVYAGHIDLHIVVPLAIGSVLGVEVGARHSHRLPVPKLKKAFAILVLLVACIITFRMVF